MTGGVAAAALVGAGVLFLSGGSKSAPVLPPQPLVQAGTSPSEPLSASAPEATDRTREQKRFDRYVKDRDGAVTREEYLAQRRKRAGSRKHHRGARNQHEWQHNWVSR